MGIGFKKLREIEFEKFNDVLADAQRAVHKSQKLFYVDSNTGSDSYNGLRLQSPKATIAGALADCTASQGDRIIVLPNHAETATSSISVSKADVLIQGLSLGNKKPVITVNGTIDLFDLSGANVGIDNLHLTISTTDAATSLVNISGAYASVKNIRMVPSVTSYNVTDCITIASGANDLLVEGCEIYNTTVAVNSFLSIEAAVARFNMRNCHFSGDCATAGIIDSAAATDINWYNNRVRTVGTTIPAVILDSNPTGVVDLFFAYGTHTTIASNVQFGNALRMSRLYTLEETDNSKQATNIIPALDVE